MTNTELPTAVGARFEAGPWLAQFAVTGVVTCEADGCEHWAHKLADGTTGLDTWHLLQCHMIERHVDLTQADFTWSDEARTVVPSEYFDELTTSLDEPAVPNGRTQDGFRRLRDVVRCEPADAEDTAE